MICTITPQQGEVNIGCDSELCNICMLHIALFDQKVFCSVPVRMCSVTHVVVFYFMSSVCRLRFMI